MLFLATRLHFNSTLPLLGSWELMIVEHSEAEAGDPRQESKPLKTKAVDKVKPLSNTRLKSTVNTIGTNPIYAIAGPSANL